MENKRPKKIITETILITGVTLVAYLSLVCYQYSFLHYFGLPNYFLEFDMMSMLFIVLILISFVLVFFICVSPLILTIKKEGLNFKNPKHILKLILFYVPYLIMVVPYYNLNWNILVNCIFQLLPFSLWTAQIIIIIYKKRKQLEENKDSNFLRKIDEKYGSFFVTFFMLSLLFIMGSLIAGKNMAKWQEEYLVVNTNPAVAIIKPYSDGFIAISFDEKARTFNRNFYLISKSDISSKQLKISREHIGPLTNGSYYIESDIFTTFFRMVFSHLNLYFK